MLRLDRELVEKRIYDLGYSSVKSFCLAKDFPYTTLRYLIAGVTIPRIDTLGILAQALLLPVVRLIKYEEEDNAKVV